MLKMKKPCRLVATSWIVAPFLQQKGGIELPNVEMELESI